MIRAVQYNDRQKYVSQQELKLYVKNYSYAGSLITYTLL